MNHELLQAVTTDNKDLLEEVLGTNRIVMEALLKGITAEGNSALHIAASYENKANEALLRASNADGSTAMHEAVSNGHFPVLKTLVLKEAGLGSIVNARVKPTNHYNKLLGTAWS
ncbi:hypothetical protein E2562_028544 [Oryza meyeriana var. granulata]|uniref:Uncharacterized protein n=1 Tax=Oryza meyeriana var. granulata TaxID=110450 RepID=A0A6G1EQM7_9ORYZ|nr:hypothetical protein E2562_028544 [Oryza meyeriana var. granulata]